MKVSPGGCQRLGDPPGEEGGQGTLPSNRDQVGNVLGLYPEDSDIPWRAFAETWVGRGSGTINRSCSAISASAFACLCCPRSWSKTPQLVGVILNDLIDPMVF